MVHTKRMVEMEEMDMTVSAMMTTHSSIRRKGSLNGLGIKNDVNHTL